MGTNSSSEDSEVSHLDSTSSKTEVKRKEGSDSSLSDSWNIIDGTDLNNISEGSDGESIEVIDEDGNNNCEGKENSQEGKIGTEEGGNSIKSNDETLVSSTQFPHEELLANETEDVSSLNKEVSDNMRVLNILGLLALICAVVCAGAMSWLFLLKVEEVALDTIHFFIPEAIKEKGNNNRDFDQLMIQLRAYEEETKSLKTLVTDLSGVVDNLKKELASSLKFSDKAGSVPTSKQNNDEVINEEDILFQELMNIHLGTYPNGNAVQNEDSSSYEEVANFVREMISNFTSGQEQVSNLESIKLFFQIPKYLAVLKNSNSTNKNILTFVDSWKTKISFINEKIVEDMKNTQIRMIRQLVKNMRRTQTKFYNKFCTLNGIKKQECIDTFVKPYEVFDELAPTIPQLSVHPNILLKGTGEFSYRKTFKGNVDDITKEPNVDDLSERKKSYEMKLEKTKENKDKIKKNPGHIKQEKNEKQGKQTISQAPSDVNYEKKNNERKNDNKPDKTTKKRKYLQIHENVIDKGMVHDFNTAAPPNNDEINLFSSFSTVEGIEKETEGKKSFKTRKDGLWKKEGGGLQEKKEKLIGPDSSEGCWFLNIGRHRSKLRKRETRSNWFFERARYRSGRFT